MNERIRELARISTDEEHDGFLYFDKERFVELILNECFAVIVDDSRFHDVKNVIQAAKEVAMEHFGVWR